jgi:hypothetical protein
MDFFGWIDFFCKLLQPVAIIAMAFVLFRWHKYFREAKNAVIELKEERLKGKEEQLKSKDEQLRNKDEQLKAKDEQIKGVEKQNEVLKLLSAEMVQKNLFAMKTMFEDQIENLENEKEEFKKKYEKTNSDLIESQARSGTKAEEIDSLNQEIQYLKEKLEQKQVSIDAVRGSQHKFQKMKLKDAYGPVGAWFLLFKSRTTSASRGEHMVERKPDSNDLDSYGKVKPIPANLRNYLAMLDEFEGKGPIYMRTEEAIANLAGKYKDDPEAFKKKMKELEAEAWEDFLDMTISQAILWAATNIQKPQNEEDHEEKGNS